MNRTLSLVVITVLVVLNVYLASFRLARANFPPPHRVTITPSLQQQVQTLQGTVASLRQQVSSLQQAQTSLSTAFYNHYHTVHAVFKTMGMNGGTYNVMVENGTFGVGSYTYDTSPPIQ